MESHHIEGWSNRNSSRRPRILLGVTGSVAAVKSPEIALRLARDYEFDVRVILTRGGRNFWEKSKEYNPNVWKEFQQLLHHTMDDQFLVTGDDDNNGWQPQSGKIPGKIIIHDADEEWKTWNRMSDKVLHIELREWADLCVVAPLSAHTLAKIAHGLCDDTLSCSLRAWEYGHGIDRPGKPLILCPAMNTAMYEHPLTKQQLDTVVSFWKDSGFNRKHGVMIVDPQVKTLACGQLGNGALAAVQDILEKVEDTVSVESAATGKSEITTAEMERL